MGLCSRPHTESGAHEVGSNIGVSCGNLNLTPSEKEMKILHGIFRYIDIMTIVLLGFTINCLL